MHIGAGQLFLIAGPCVIESEAHVRKMAEAIQRITSDLGIPYIFKASYDKANRTSVKSFRGPGLLEGTRILGRLAKDTGLPVLTDVHEPSQCEIAAEGADVLQIPAFLCRQTDLLVAAGKTGRAINVKKGQFVAPWDMKHTVEKFATTGNSRIFLTERGASFGYNNLVVDMRSLPVMRKLAPVVFDGTHSVQTPSAANGVSGGQPEFIPVLTRAAVAAGVDGIFLEVHDNPAHRRRRPVLHIRACAHRPAQVLGRARHRRPYPGNGRRPGRARQRLPLPADHQRRLHRSRHRQDPGAAGGPPGGTQGDARQRGRAQAEDGSRLGPATRALPAR